MSKKKGKLGKLFAFTTTAVAIGGTCYVFRDKIKQSPVYQTASSKFSDVFQNITGKSCNDEDDFFFDDEDADFAADPETKREYTSITTTVKESASPDEQSNDTDSIDIDSADVNATNTDSADTNSTNIDSADTHSTNTEPADTAVSETKENIKENVFSESAESSEYDNDSETSNADNETEIKENTADNSDNPTADSTASDDELIEIFPRNNISSIPFGNVSSKTDSAPTQDKSESLSDTSEDPDTLAEQDKLDF